MKVLVTGIGLVSALGGSLEDSWKNLIAGKSGIRLHQPFPEIKPLPLGLIAQQPSELTMLTQMVVASALQDAGLVPPLADCAVVIGSSRSYQASWERLARQMYKDAKNLPVSDFGNWLEILPHINAIAAARQIGATGMVLAPMAACATGIWSIAQAALLIQTGQCQQAIAGAVEAPITPLTLAGFQQMGALAKTGAYPFDLQREGLVLGEGAAVFVLESAELAKQRQAKVYGEILGFGLTNDAYHSNSPEPEGKSAIAAIKKCLERSCLTPSDIDYIHAHGTATQLNDQMESMVIRRLFPQGVAVSSTKGSTGHTLGASGALGVAFSLMALKHQILPPCVGLQQPEFDLEIVTATRLSKIRQVLCLSFGFGGQNVAIALA
ncbi:beta-ketoacyl-ACP synthase [Nostoc sp. UCD121]|uniref:beta-ketoacyl-ACP synthase n=1 Tax=unclassified Nostoc TaxID=2593658 RepID=UPI001626641A|nr:MULTISPECIES: beta-ketoacyl-ACP synthase [unclassified Nostoc]MBC1219804.1 beta-ketoacyl-ACP synthase [Nostoc sp. UCD120]MBC1275888.1 beta-ketoacyl-ACP synthase [Nostoc sp. UCD121]MBC1294551.1 beta-ketoacyl-ACP synthase [Nostoc sp. UCD122]